MQHRQSSHFLRVDLRDVCKTLGQDITGHLVAVLVSELGSLTTRSHDRSSCVCDGTSHNTTDRRRKSMDVRDGRGVDKLVGDLLLRDDYCTVLAADANGGDVCCGDGLECIFCGA